MGIQRSWSGIAERLGSGTADFMDNVAEGVRDFSCGLWAAFPAYITENKNLGSSFARGYLNNVCSDKGNPPAPTSPFVGGQCETQYEVNVTFDFFPQFSSTPQTQTQNIGVFVQGPIADLVGVLISNDEVIRTTLVREGFPDSLLSDTSPAGIGSIIDGTIQYSVEREDGLPDNCGDTPPKYPSVQPDPETDFKSDITINIEDGGDLIIPVEYKPTDFTFPITIDVGGVIVELNLGGINFNFNFIGINGNPFPLPDGQPAPIPPPSVIRRGPGGGSKFPPPNDQDFDEEEKMEEDEKEETVGLQLEYVEVELTSIPVNAKSQWGDGAPDVYYAGWFEFTTEGYNYNRVPIHFQNNVFRAPDGATGYAYTLYNGFQGRAIVYKRKEE